MKKPAFIILSFLLYCFWLAPAAGRASSVIVSGDVYGTWGVDTVFVDGDLFVPEDSLLTILPGTLVLFNGPYKVKVMGSIRALGEPGLEIRFSSSDTSGFADTLSNAGGWAAFEYEHMIYSADSSVFRYCRFEYGKAFSADTMGMYGGAFRIYDFDKLSFSNCTFFHNMAIRSGGAIYAKNSDILVEDCIFTGNLSGLSAFPWGYGGGLCSVSSEAMVIANLFVSNRATGVGGGASFEFADPILQDNIFRQNRAGLGGGLCILRSARGRTVCNNLVTGNEAQFFGGGVAIIRSFTLISNITIADNLSMMGGGFYCNDSAAPTLYNSILTSNTGFGSQVYIWDFLSAPNFYYCDVEGGPDGFEGSGGQAGYHGNYENNLDTVPLFTGSGDTPYALQPDSPLRDGGTPDTSGLSLPSHDLYGNPRIYNGRIDQGAYEYTPGAGKAMGSPVQPVLRVFPNPFTNETKIRVETENRSFLRVVVTDIEGRPVRTFPEILKVRKISEYVWDGRDDHGAMLPGGLYIIQATSGSSQNSVKVIFAKP